jgi:4-hydroxy-tetrahydrodipicolinate synthase
MFKGSIVALTTPFTISNEIDLLTLSELVEWHIAMGTQGIVLSGTTGESPVLTHEEKLSIFKASVDVAKGRIPIIAGTGSYDTKESVVLTEEAKRIGVDGCLVVVPYYNRPTVEGCYRHYEAISKVGLPTILYHHPGRTGVKLSSQAIARICTLENMVAIKEATGDVDFAIELMQATSTPLLSGDDSLTLPLMACGAVGVISVVANIIPKEWQEFVSQLLVNEIKVAREMFDRYYPLCKAMVLETNPQCVKYALSTMGKCSSLMRLPLIEPQEENRKKILAAMEQTMATAVSNAV